jgi:ribose/xylose/arabinose/galactoside ABC-type transport system permease subunit
MLLVALVAVGIVLTVAYPNALSRGTIWGQTAFAAMYAGALALSLRTATPNLSVTTIGAACGWWYAQLVNDGTASLLAWLIVLAAALGIGLVVGALVGLTPLPAWAVSIVATSILGGGLLVGDSIATVPLRQPSGAGTGVFITWTILFLIGSVVVATLLAVPSVGAKISQNRPVPGAPAARLPGRLMGALLGLGGSSLLAGVGGVLFVLRLRAAQPFDGVGLTMALAAVLLGGVSLLGRRGGIIGVAVAVLLLAFTQLWMNLAGFQTGTQRLVLGVLGAVGLGVNVLMEFLGGLVERGPKQQTAQQLWPQPTAWPAPAGQVMAAPWPQQPNAWSAPAAQVIPTPWPQPAGPA